MRRLLFSGLLFLSMTGFSQQKAIIKEYSKAFPTYPFSDPDPIPDMGKIYPYFRFDGYASVAVQKTWKVVELENDYIKVMILPEVGGKIWSAIEKASGKSFIYYNKTVKFRDVAMRGPWTSGGIEANYGIIGHTPNCATPVDYTVFTRSDGSVSCVIGVFDLLTRTSWRVDINLAKDKAYFTTSSFWYNSSPMEQPYYTWMNTGLKAAGNLQFIYPGTKYIGHEGEHADWPMNKEKGKDISYYENNNFGEYKSYHVFGKRSEFFGAYWHDDDYGMGRFSTHDDKAGKKIWIWGLSDQGMIWDKLLTDTDGQYVEVQSGRLFNQASEGSSNTPFKHTGFAPNATDLWTEYWFPVMKTKGFVAANNYGSLNLKSSNGQLNVFFSPLQSIQDTLTITAGSKVIYSKLLTLAPLQLFTDSIRLNADASTLQASLGKEKLRYDAAPSADNIDRPVDMPADFDWSSSYGLYLSGKELLRQRHYPLAEEKLRASLAKEPYYMPALTDLAMILYRNRQYAEALTQVKKALSIDTYDPAANYYYGLINMVLDNMTDAKDGFDIAAMGVEYRSAAYTSLAKIYLKEGKWQEAADYARKSISFNKYAIDAYQLLAVISRLRNDNTEAKGILDTLRQYDPLNHFSRFETWLWQPTETNKTQFTGMIRNEMPQEIFLELAIWYHSAGRNDDASKLLEIAPANAEIAYWKAFLNNTALQADQLDPAMVFPFRSETAEVITSLMQKNNHWILKYHLGLLEWNFNHVEAARKWLQECGETPSYAPFYAARVKLYGRSDPSLALKDMLKAKSLDKNQWRYGKNLIDFYLNAKQQDKALALAGEQYARFPDNYVLGMAYVKTLTLAGQYAKANELLKKINILPNEGATEGRQIYKEVNLMLALEQMKKNNGRKALSYVQAAKLWPQRLGVGKPYDEDIDDRLENWMEYLIYNRQGNNKEAAVRLEKITSYVGKERRQSRFSANDLVSALAMQKTGQSDNAQKRLQTAAEGKSGNAMAKWALNAFNGQYADVEEGVRTDENYRVLSGLLKSGVIK